MDEFGFPIILAWRNHNQKRPCDSGGATRIGTSVKGGRKTGEAGAWFSLLFALINIVFPLSVFTRLASANGIRDRNAGRWFTRLASANGIRDRIVGSWITRLASANDIPDRIAGRWITRLASANGIRDMIAGK